MRRHAPAVAPLATALQRGFVTRTKLLTLMATTAIFIEAGAPLALYSDLTALAFGVAVMGFHVGVALLQQLDFLSLWAPALLVFLVPLTRARRSRSHDRYVSYIRYIRCVRYGLCAPAALYPTIAGLRHRPAWHAHRASRVLLRRDSCYYVAEG